MAPGLSDEQAGEVLTREAARSPVGANGVLAFLGPSAADMGAAGPRVGGLVFPLLGDVHRAGRGDIARAALEALAFAVRANLEQAAEVAGVTPAVIAFGGGMAGNPVLRRTVADVLARPVGVPRQSGVTLLGAAVLAAVAAGAYDTVLQAVSTMACPTRTQPPDAVRSLEYEEHYQRWRASAAALDTLASRL
jgi:sugar (pentulose or hexulose) kinase